MLLKLSKRQQEKEALYESALEKLELALMEDSSNLLALRQCGLALLDLGLMLRDTSPKQHRRHLQARASPKRYLYCPCSAICAAPSSR